MAKALHEEGFDFNIGPLADIATLDSAISDRAFSDDPAVVNAMVAGAFAGCAEHKVACIPAHFPGQGGAAEDTGSGPASVAIDAGTLETRDIPAFAAAFEQGAPAVVISNAFFSAYDPVTPASLSPAVLDGVLRRGLGFGGVAISGDLLEGAIRSGYKVDRGRGRRDRGRRRHGPDLRSGIHRAGSQRTAPSRRQRRDQQPAPRQRRRPRARDEGADRADELARPAAELASAGDEHAERFAGRRDPSYRYSPCRRRFRGTGTSVPNVPHPFLWTCLRDVRPAQLRNKNASCTGGPRLPRRWELICLKVEPSQVAT